ncbi:MAG TPA: CRISPR system precrRNA processing endoribonuclease RAMP protein Cas6 [Anaerolineae bacterium]|nr:CRISPR system precrRNA processing endoribonuclease RAMP protein Cas6 [Anaerolineae bacterium]HIQ06216.1 CRISPR system precrRNA processing endoribonuclease RAMP protein Cas6 [Anaerolineae bacterium]
MDSIKPFTISTLFRRRGWEGFVWRITTLDDRLLMPLVTGLSQARTVDILGQELAIAHDRIEMTGHSYADLAVQAGTDTQITVRFVSPTSFRSQERHYLLPDPVVVWQSWLNRWNGFAPAELQYNVNTLDAVTAHVAISRYDLHTETTRYREQERYQQIGFVGRVTYRVIRPHLLGPEILRRLNVLADYATYCGTGHHTARGMGQTRRVARLDAR